jgi:hypothetical protein
MPFDRLGDDAVLVEHYRLRVDRDVPAVAGLLFDERGDFAILQTKKVAYLWCDVAAARL